MKCLCVLFVLLLLQPVYSADTDWEEMAQFVEQIDAVVTAQAQDLQTLRKQLKEQSEQMRKQQLQFKGCVILSTAIVASLTTLLIKEKLSD